ITIPSLRTNLRGEAESTLENFRSTEVQRNLEIISRCRQPIVRFSKCSVDSMRVRVTAATVVGIGNAKRQCRSRGKERPRKPTHSRRYHCQAICCPRPRSSGEHFSQEPEHTPLL